MTTAAFHSDELPPLEGVRVIDLGSLLPGPVCGLHLAWLGADVIKVEPPTGDPGRHLYDGAFFDTYNRGKRSVALDLKTPDGLAAACELCRDADVLIENFRPGVMERLGLDYSALSAANPGLIYCSISGYGRGSRVKAPAHDLNFLARSGALGAATTWSGQTRSPTRPAMPIGDFGGAAMAVQAILAALYRRSRTSKGARIDIAMSEVLLHWLAWRTAASDRTDPNAWTRYLEPANDIYETADGGSIVIGAIESHLWRKLAEVVLDEGRDLKPAPALADWDWRDRRRHAPELAALLSNLFKTRARDWWVARLEAAGVPADPVYSPAEAFSDPWVTEQGLIGEDGWARPPMPGVGALPPAPALDADGQAIRDGRAWLT